MRKVSFTSYTTSENDELSDQRDTTIWLLNRLNVAFILNGKNSQKIPEAQARVVSALLISACSTGANISSLVEKLSVCSKDALPLARTFYEASLNACYLMTDGGELADRVALFSVYKKFKTQTQHSKLGKFSTLVEHHPKLDRHHPLVAQSISVFESSPSHQATKAVTASRTEMIQKISEVSPKAGILFQGAEAMNFDLASEISHGSYFGFQYVSGDFGIRPSASQKVSIDIPYRATAVVVLCADAIGRVMKVRVPNLIDANHLSEAAEIFYKSEAPEFFED